MRIVRASELNYEPASHEPPENPGVLKKVLARKTDLLEGQIRFPGRKSNRSDTVEREFYVARQSLA